MTGRLDLTSVRVCSRYYCCPLFQGASFLQVSETFTTETVVSAEQKEVPARPRQQLNQKAIIYHTHPLLFQQPRLLVEQHKRHVFLEVKNPCSEQIQQVQPR